MIEMRMRQIIKTFLLIVPVVFSLRTAWGFALLGPVGNGSDSWQIQANGFNPIEATPLNPFPFVDLQPIGPKNLDQGYRHNTPVMYYAFDSNFLGYFGSDGTNAVAGAFDILNSLTNVDSYSSDLSEFPLQTLGFNYQAQTWGLIDLKSLTLTHLVEQLGLADAVRYTWVIHSRWHVGATPCPVGENYLVTERNFDVTATALQDPIPYSYYTPYVNDAFYTYAIQEFCDNANAAPLTAAAIAVPVDPLNDNPPVASGDETDWLPVGSFYTGLTRDDVAGLRYLLRAGNVNVESPAAGSLLESITPGTTNLLPTADLSLLLSASITNDPVTLSTLFPGLLIAGSMPYFTNVNIPIIITYTTNYYGEAVGTPPHVVTVTNGTNVVIETYYHTTFANVITNSFRSNSIAKLMTTTVGLPIGQPVGSPFVTNTSIKTVTLTNVPSGDYYILPAGTCAWNIMWPQLTNVIITTNLIYAATNSSGASTTESLITYFTNHVYVAQQIFCTNEIAPAAKYEGIENIQFIMANPTNIVDPLSGQFATPITNVYTMSLVQNDGTVVIQTFQRVLTQPDFLFTAQDMTGVGGGQTAIGRSLPNFNTANVATNMAGPGTIDPGCTIIFNNSGPIYENTSPYFLNGPNYGDGFFYGSFDGTTNAPVVYPSGTSITNLETEVFIQIFPAALPDGTNGSAYSAAFSATGGQAPYTWSLASSSPGLPVGLTLSTNGVMSGIPAQGGVYDFTIQLGDSASHTVRKDYFITIH